MNNWKLTLYISFTFLALQKTGKKGPATREPASKVEARARAEAQAKQKTDAARAKAKAEALKVWFQACIYSWWKEANEYSQEEEYFMGQ